MVFILPRKEGNAELAQSFSPLAEALGYLAGGKLRQLKHRAAYHTAGIPENQAEAWSQLPAAQQKQAWQEYIDRGGLQYTGEQGPSTTVQPTALSAPQPYRMQPQTMQRVGAHSAMQQAPQIVQQRMGITNPAQAAYAGAQAGPNYQAQLATGRPQDQLQAATSGIQALQKAQLSGALGYQPQKQELAQQQMSQPKPVGSAPTLQNTGGIAPKLPSETPRVQPDESGIPIEYRGLGLKPYQKPKRDTYANIMASPKLKDEAKLEKEFYEKQLTAKENASKAEAPKLKKIYAEADVAAKAIPALEEISDLNRRGKIEYSRISKAGWIGQLASALDIGEQQGTARAKELLMALPQNVRAELGLSGSAKGRQVKIDKYLNEYRNAEAKKNALDQIIDESNGWIPKDIDRVVNQRAKIQQREQNMAPRNEQQQEVVEPEDAGPGFIRQVGGVTGVVPRAAELIGGSAGGLTSLAAQGIKYLTGSDNKVINAVIDNPFTPTGLRENITKQITGELFEPTGSWSKNWQDVAGTALALASPGGAVGLINRTGKAIGAVLTGRAASKALEVSGAHPLAQAIGEVAVTSALLGGQYRQKLENTQSQLYKQANKIAQASNDTLPMQAIGDKVADIYTRVANRGFKGKDELLKILAPVETLAKQPNRSITEVWNAAVDAGTHYDKSTPAIHGYLGELIGEIKKELYEYGNKNPEWGKVFAPAEAIRRGIGEADRAIKTARESEILNGVIGGRAEKAVRLAQETGKEIAALYESSPQAKKIAHDLYRKLLTRDVVGAETRYRQLQKLKEQADEY